MKIVIVEDEPRIREGIKKLLTKADPDFEVLGEAENGRDGAALLLAARPDLALVDIRMPEMDGIEMLQAVKEQGFQPAAIILSAYSDFSYAQRAMKLGVSEYLVKPIVVDELIGAVRRTQETIRLQSIAQQGLQSESEVLARALLTDTPFPPNMLEYIECSLHIGEQTAFQVLLLHDASAQEDADALKRELQAGIRAFALEECTLIPTAAQRDVLAVWKAPADERHLRFVLEKRILAGWKEQKAFVAQLGACCGLSALRGLCQELQSHMEYGLILQGASLLYYPDMLKWELEMFSYPIELENAARTALARRDHAAVRARIDDFGRLFSQGRLYAPREMKEAHVRFMWALLSTARELGNHAAEGLSRQALLEKIMSAVHPQELEAVRRELAQRLCQEENAPKAASLLVRRAESLMKGYYAQGITLEEIAQKLSVTPEYLGTQIHRELGLTFGTLMKRLRVERAKELFLTTDKKLYEVSQMVGYADHKYFSKVFQSVTGMLPAEYRRMHK